MKFPIHTPDTAKVPAAEQLRGVEASLGFQPNLFGVIAESVPALTAFMAINQQFGESSLTALEREVIQVAASVVNECAYCIAGHTAFAQSQELDESVIVSVRTTEELTDPKLSALQDFVVAVVRSRGHLSPNALADLEIAGYRPHQVMEIVLGICVKFFSNLVNNIVGIPLDKEFEPFMWQSKLALSPTNP